MMIKKTKTKVQTNIFTIHVKKEALEDLGLIYI